MQEVNEHFCAELAGVLCMITEVVLFICCGLGGWRKVKASFRVQNIKSFPYRKFIRVLLMTSVKPRSHAENLDGSDTLW